jgi:HEAT repeat protein
MIDDPDYTNSTIRLLAFQALKHWETKAIFPLLSDEDYVVRSAAARELQIRGGEDTFEKLQNLVGDPVSYVREIVAFALGQLGTPNFPYKEQSIPLLLNLLSDDDFEVRAAAVAAFGHLGIDGMPEVVEEQLVAMVDDQSEDVRECLACALGSSSGSEKVVVTLVRLQNDSSERVRSWAAIGFELLEDKILGAGSGLQDDKLQ